MKNEKKQSQTMKKVSRIGVASMALATLLGVAPIPTGPVEVNAESVETANQSETAIDLEASNLVIARLGTYKSRYYRLTITLVDEAGNAIEGLTEEDFNVLGFGGIVNFSSEGNVYRLDTAEADDLRPETEFVIVDGQITVAIGDAIAELPEEEAFELPRPAGLKHQRLAHGTMIYSKDFVTNKDEFPEGTTFEFFDYDTNTGTDSIELDVAPNPESRNERLVIRASHPDAVESVDSFSFTVVIEAVEEKIELPRPNGLKHQRLPHGTTIYAKDFVTNKDEFPEDTTFEFFDYDTNTGTDSLELDVAPNPESRNERLVIRASHPDAVESADSFSFTVVIEAEPAPEATEVRVLINVRTPKNMYDYAEALEDFSKHPLVLTNQVTGEKFRSTVAADEGNTSNDFQLEAEVHAYERGYAPENNYEITLPQEMIDKGYSLTRDHVVRSNYGIVGMTNLSYNAPQADENVGELSARHNYSYMEGRDIEYYLESADGLRTYNLQSRTVDIPSGEYNLRVVNVPEDSTPELLLKESNLASADERVIELTVDGADYIGTLNLDFTDSTRPQILEISPVVVEETFFNVTLDANGGSIDEEYIETEVEEGEAYTLPYGFASNIAREGYTLTGYMVEGTLLDADGNEVTEIPRFSQEYTPQSDVSLTANWEETTGKFSIQLYGENPAAQTDNYSVKLVAEDGREYELTSNSHSPDYRTWEADNIPNGTYTLLVDGFELSSGEKHGQNDTTSDFVVNGDGTATVELGFVDDKSTTFIRYKAYGEAVEEAPETDADRYEPIIADEIVLDLNRGNGKLKNPKTLIENMNEMPGGFKIEYSNEEVLDLSGETTKQQMVELTVTYRDGSSETIEVPLRVIPEEEKGNQNPERPNVGNIVKTVTRAIKTITKSIFRIVNLFGSIFN